MDIDSESTATSIDDNTENFCENPTRDTLAEGLMGLIKPTIDNLDERVKATRYKFNKTFYNHYKSYTFIEYLNWS